MKIIVSYASVGAGHFKAAQAMYNYFKENNPDIDVKLIDVLQYSNRYFRRSYISGYAFMVSHAHWLWGFLFYITYLRRLRPLTRRLNFFINRLNTVQFAKILFKENPDFIISTHFLPCEIATYLIRKGIIRARLITVITDFGVHPFWLAEATDIYIAASDFTKQQLMAEGVEENKIKVLGIPIEPKFQVQFETEALFHKFTVLLITGSFGIGPIEEIVALLYKDVQVLVVCAKNKRLFMRLGQKSYPNVKVFGFVDNIEELMAIADIVITKPGGLTISELLSMERLPLFISAIPGQETENAHILERYGIGKKIKNIKEIKSIVLDFKLHPDKLDKLKAQMRNIKRPFSTKEICNAICASSIGVTH